MRGMRFYWDPTYILMIPAILFAMYAQFKVNSTYSKYSKVKNARGLTGEQVARQILDNNGLFDVRIERIAGQLTDHYDPRDNVVRLSQGIYSSDSVSAVGIAAHEVGHAIQHAENYAPVKIRGALVPATKVGSSLGMILVIAGLFFNTKIAWIGIILFSLTTLFALVTLPVEFNASMRAMKILKSYNILYDEELTGVRKVLSAAAMTYVAGLLSSVLTLLRLILITNRRDD